MSIDFLVQLLLGALLGALGQMLRSVTGLKKLYDQAQATGQSASSLFLPSRFFVSLAIGATAGALALLGLTGDGGSPVGREVAFTLVGAGYAGTDFLEGFLQRHLPNTPSKGTTVPAAASALEDDGLDLQPPPVG